jgi:hypothetical protein
MSCSNADQTSSAPQVAKKERRESRALQDFNIR